MRRLMILILLPLCCAGCQSPGDDAAVQTSAAQPIAAETDGLSALRWMAGAWVNCDAESCSEEIILPPQGGAMPGIFRLTQGDRVGFYEFFLIEQTDAGVQLRIHHFHPGMSRWEDEPVTLDLLECAGQQAVFAERNDPEEQTHLTYARSEHGMLVTLSELVGGERKEVLRFEYTSKLPAEKLDLLR